jgi:trans-2,3-dihydro-3-hydroxyanthranilate isomerase
MARYAFYTLDVFTDRIFGGNPLAVFPNGLGLETEQMQAIAREFNLSETVFVLPPEEPDHTRRLRIFTPGTELPFAGHPTIGTAHLLATIGGIPLDGAETHIVLEEAVGPVAVTIRTSGGRPTLAQLSAARRPEHGPAPPPVDEIAEVLSLATGDIMLEPLPAAVSCGVPFLFIMLRNVDALARAQIRHAAWQRTFAHYWAPHIYLLVPAEADSSTTYRARMFAPAMGITEDPATGAAATALPGYLAPLQAKLRGTLRWTVHQGVEMSRPSRLEVEADLADGNVIAVRVSGSSVLVSHGEMEIPQSIGNSAE